MFFQQIEHKHVMTVLDVQPVQGEHKNLSIKDGRYDAPRYYIAKNKALHSMTNRKRKNPPFLEEQKRRKDRLQVYLSCEISWNSKGK